jgi:hypothetical protein
MAGKSFLTLSSALILSFILFQNPVLSISGEEGAPGVSPGKPISDHSSERGVIGQIRTRDKVIIILSGADGRLYTVKSKEGNILAKDLNSGELNVKFPELKNLVENGLAGDASLRLGNTPDDRILSTEGIKK